MPTIIHNQVQQPQPFDLVGDPVRISGLGQGFEAVLNWRIHDGHDERTGFFTVGGGTGEHGQFQVAAAIGAAAFQLDRLFVEVFEESAADGSELNKVIVPVIYGPRIVANYVGFRLHRVVAGDTLSKIAAANYGDPGLFGLIQRANPHIITDPNRIFVGQELKVPIGV
ncbi:Gmad2 immunoglobulin-like domain-containing protein [Mesorhizobium sp. J428]|uniref:LysM peptidoglycan-binding domain-containing protein n=1 Tax=Mesorhizobium sp. J428 TaxID=2898440 RepID=UPI00215097B2|nr:Gmad2 immunoglobulin-like domain-containing protein [Mesorhizobium sp. J428]MCR5860014.1 LysM peptidoglycan-binding domain-containing protein [Mesorhizobium sp. J428]